jgi:hypothetical protein
MTYRHQDYEDVPQVRARRPGPRPTRSLAWLWLGLGLGGAVVVVLVAVGILVLARRSPAGPNPAIQRMPGLVAYWSFDEVQGGKVPDRSGKGHDATLNGGRLGDGARGQGLWLDGRPDEFCDLGPSNDLNFAANAGFTFAGWFLTSDASAAILSLRNGHNDAPQIDVLVREGRLIVVVGDDNDRAGQNAFVWGPPVSDGRWHHFAFTRSGNVIELFVDGVSQGNGVGLSAGGPITTDLRALGAERLWSLHNDGRWGSPTFRGGLDELCVFNRALADADVQTLAAR